MVCVSRAPVPGRGAEGGVLISVVIWAGIAWRIATVAITVNTFCEYFVL